MKVLFLFFISLIDLTASLAQKSAVTSEILSAKQVTSFFTNTTKKELKLTLPIFRVYKYEDKSGQYYMVLTESRDSIVNDRDTFNQQIRGIAFKIEKEGLNKIYELNDYIKKDLENSIWFWTKYIDFKDYDNDSLADPIIVYGTSAINGTDDGRIKFLIYYKWQKVAIRHQNGILDLERETQIDKAFYSLPVKLQSAIKQKIELMMKNNHAIFPRGWQTALKNNKTIFHE